MNAREAFEALVKLAEDYDPSPEGTRLPESQAVIDFIHGDDVVEILNAIRALPTKEPSGLMAQPSPDMIHTPNVTPPLPQPAHDQQAVPPPAPDAAPELPPYPQVMQVNGDALGFSIGGHVVWQHDYDKLEAYALAEHERAERLAGELAAMSEQTTSYLRQAREACERAESAERRLAMVDGASPALMNDLEAMLKAGGEQ